MVVIKVELWPLGMEDRARELARLYIRNRGREGNGTPTQGEYDVHLMRRGEKRPPYEIGFGGNATAKPLRVGRVERYARKTAPVLHLVRLAIDSLYPRK